MKKGVFSGIFDPPTLGHLDIIKRGAQLFDFLYVAVGQSIFKPHPTFNKEERVLLLKKITHSIPNVEVVSFDGLLAEYAHKMQATAILKSIRNFSDFESEVTQAHMNMKLSGIETIYIAAGESFCFINSTLIREIAQYGRRLHGFVSEEIEEEVFTRLSKKNI